MGKVQVTIKNVDEQAFAELKAEAARKKLAVGAAVSLAIEKWISESKSPKLPLSQWRTVKTDSKSSRLSKEIDSILYG